MFPCSSFFFFFSQIYYLRDRQLPSAGSVLQWHSTGLGQTKATNLDFHPAPLLGWLEPSSVAFPAIWQGAGSEVAQKGLEPVLYRMLASQAVS